MLTWNVNRHVKKINDIDFIETIPEYYLTFLSEAWLSNQHTINPDIKGFENIQIYGQKTRRIKKGRYSGGLANYFWSKLKKVLVVETREEGIIWIKIICFTCRKMCLFVTHTFHQYVLQF